MKRVSLDRAAAVLTILLLLITPCWSNNNEANSSNNSNNTSEATNTTTTETTTEATTETTTEPPEDPEVSIFNWTVSLSNNSTPLEGGLYLRPNSTAAWGVMCDLNNTIRTNTHLLAAGCRAAGFPANTVGAAITISGSTTPFQKYALRANCTSTSETNFLNCVILIKDAECSNKWLVALRCTPPRSGWSVQLANGTYGVVKMKALSSLSLQPFAFLSSQEESVWDAICRSVDYPPTTLLASYMGSVSASSDYEYIYFPLGISCAASVSITNCNIGGSQLLAATTSSSRALALDCAPSLADWKFEFDNPAVSNVSGVVRMRPRSEAPWGYVCASGYTDNEYNALCRSLGFTLGKSTTYSPQQLQHSDTLSSSPVYLASPGCTSSSPNLQACQLSRIGRSRCGNYNVGSSSGFAAVKCYTDVPSQWKVRLTGGATNSSGRLEILIGPKFTEWSTVCGNCDSDPNLPRAVCKSLGFINPTFRPRYSTTAYNSGSTSLPTYFSNFRGCGDTITSCQYDFLNNSCQHSDDVRIECEPPDNDDQCNRHLRVFWEFKLDGGTAIDGRLLMRPNSTTTEWGTVCAAGPNTPSEVLNAACTSLGFPPETAATWRTGFSPSSNPVYLSGLNCSAAATGDIAQPFLENCTMNPFASTLDSSCTSHANDLHANDLALECLPPPANWSVVLMGENNTTSDRGIAMMRALSSLPYQPIAASYDPLVWDAVCRAAGFNLTELSSSFMGYEQVTAEAVYMKGLNCNSTGSLLDEGCSRTKFLSTVANSVLGMMIDCNPRRDGWQFRLVKNDTKSYTGVAQMRPYDSAQWGYVCADGFNEIDYRSLCKSLGYGSGIAVDSFQVENKAPPYYLADPGCTAPPRTVLPLHNCMLRRLGEANCSKLAAVMCAPSNPSQWEIKLDDGKGDSNPKQGRLLMRPSKEHPWGTACGNCVNMPLPRAVCWELGFRDAKLARFNLNRAKPEGYYGPAKPTETIYYSNWSCVDTVNFPLSRCEFDLLYNTTCDHSQDITVECYPTDSVKQCDLPLRDLWEFKLGGGRTEFRGRVYMRPNNESKWGTICSDNIKEQGNPAPTALCRSLGFPEGTVGYFDSIGADTEVPIYLSGMQCGPNDTLIQNCTQHNIGEYGACDHGDDTGVFCYPPRELWEFRLENGTSESNGYVVMRYMNGTPWRPVDFSGDYGTIKAACRSVNQESTRVSYVRSIKGGQGFLSSRSDCTNTLSDCQYYDPWQFDPTQANAVWVDCNIPLDTWEVRIYGENGPNSIRGYPAMRPASYYPWGWICHGSTDKWTKLTLMSICRSAGFISVKDAVYNYTEIRSAPKYNDIYYSPGPKCEVGQNFSECDHDEYGVQGCGGHITVDCDPPEDNTSLWIVSLVDGPNNASGRLQIKGSAEMKESTVVNRDAFKSSKDYYKLVCSSAGHMNATNARENYYPRMVSGSYAGGSGPTYYSNWSCPTGATKLEDCDYSFMMTKQKHEQDVSVECFPPTPNSSSWEYKLINPQRHVEKGANGLLQVKVNGVWSVATQEEGGDCLADAVCRKVNASGGENRNVVVRSIHNNPSALPNITRVVCSENEEFPCEYEYMLNYKYETRNIYVMCNLPPNEPSKFEYRIVNGTNTNSSRGILEFRPNSDEDWGSYSYGKSYYDKPTRSFFSHNIARAVCKHLGFTNWSKALLVDAKRHLYMSPNESSIVWYSDLKCGENTSNTSLLNCSRGTLVPSYNSHDTDLGVICEPDRSPVIFEEGNSTRGRILINRENLWGWGTVCNDQFARQHIAWNAACRSAGVENFTQAKFVSFGPANQSTQIWLSNVICPMDALYLDDCKHDGWGVQNCVHHEDAGVDCFPPPENYSIWKFRLIGHPDKRTDAGRIELLTGPNERWGMICPDVFNHSHKAWLAACHSVGLTNTTRAKFVQYGAGGGPILLDHVNCSMVNNSAKDNLTRCETWPVGSYNCQPFEAAGVDCNPPDDPPPTKWEWKLVDGDTNESGRLVMRPSPSSPWSTVCDNGIKDDRHAWIAACRAVFGLRIRNATYQYFGPGTGSIILDNWTCHHDDFYLYDCDHDPLYSHQCTHEQDFGVVCDILTITETGTSVTMSDTVQLHTDTETLSSSTTPSTSKTLTYTTSASLSTTFTLTTTLSMPITTTETLSLSTSTSGTVPATQSVTETITLSLTTTGSSSGSATMAPSVTLSFVATQTGSTTVTESASQSVSATETLYFITSTTTISVTTSAPDTTTSSPSQSLSTTLSPSVSPSSTASSTLYFVTESDTQTVTVSEPLSTSHSQSVSTSPEETITVTDNVTESPTLYFITDSKSLTITTPFPPPGPCPTFTVTWDPSPPDLDEKMVKGGHVANISLPLSTVVYSRLGTEDYTKYIKLRRVKKGTEEPYGLKDGVLDGNCKQTTPFLVQCFLPPQPNYYLYSGETVQLIVNRGALLRPLCLDQDTEVSRVRVGRKDAEQGVGMGITVIGGAAGVGGVAMSILTGASAMDLQMLALFLLSDCASEYENVAALSIRYALSPFYDLGFMGITIGNFATSKGSSPSTHDSSKR